MIGIVLVSHSQPLAVAARDLAQQMIPADGPALEVAAGIDNGADFGTDATAISAAIEAADSGDGVLVLVDMGSAIMSADMALEFIDPEVAARTRIAPAPFVEGLVAAAVTAAGGGCLDAVTQAAASALEGKLAALRDAGMDTGVDAGMGDAERDDTVDNPTDNTSSKDGGNSETVTITISDPVGLHARPAAVLATEMGRFDAEVEAYNDDADQGPVDAASVMMLVSLGVRGGADLRLVATGPQAHAALERAQELAAQGLKQQ